MISTELFGSIPRTPELLSAISDLKAGRTDGATFARIQDRAVRETGEALEVTGSPVITDGEQAQPSFLTYPVEGLSDLDADGALIPLFPDGHTRQLPRLTSGPFRYKTHAKQYLRSAKAHAKVPVKQAVAPLIPEPALPVGRDRRLPARAVPQGPDQRSEDGTSAAAWTRARTLSQLDFEEGRLALTVNPSGGPLREFIDLNNQVLERFTDAERARIGVYSGPEPTRAQPRRRLRRTAAAPGHAHGRNLLPPAGRRARPGPRPARRGRQPALRVRRRTRRQSPGIEVSPGQ
ncbi:hypothetical protein [Streptomyces sp. NPDC085596]|uniref:hypothetical protein n=1 Tax=Streptomyces sp. NPDC085596 TaxID=3365731 RepID=UPI0037CFBE1B